VQLSLYLVDIGTVALLNIFRTFINYNIMAKILFLISIMLLSSYLTEQSKLSHDNMIDKSDIDTNTLKVSKYYVIF